MTTIFEKRIEMSTFLLQMQTLFIKYKFTESNTKHIYKKLVSIGISEKEIRKDLSEVFTTLQENNKYNDKMDVFVSPHWQYFCQFKSKNADQAHYMNPIKLYIPLKRENIEESVQKIFNFINQNNIEHCSKLASEVRVDDLVIRVIKKEDADKIIEFINNDQELTKNMYEPNPFCISEGKIGLAMDRRLSYNSILSKYIFYYIKETTNQQVMANYEGFTYFIKRNLDQLKEKTDLSEQIKNYADSESLSELPIFLQNLEEITNIILKNLEGNTKESLYREFEQTNEITYLENKAEEYGEFDYSQMYLENSKLLYEILNIMSNKYGEIATKNNLNKYKETGKTEHITRINNLRDRVIASKTFRTYINYIDLDREMEILIPKKGETQKLEANLSKETILEMISKETYHAAQTEERGYCGMPQVAAALINMKYGRYDWITRKNNSRIMAQENIKPEEVEEIIRKSLEKNGYIIENELDLYQLYATHIEHLCNNNEMGRGRR